MTPVATNFFFFLLAGVTLISGILVITQRNPVHSALALILGLLAQANLYLMLYAPFVAGVQVILYAGGIMVLFLFVIMLVNLERAKKEEQFNKLWLIGTAAAAALGFLFFTVYLKGKALWQDQGTALPPETSNTQEIGRLLYGQYMFTFEIASLLLLVAIIGAVVMTKRKV
ncbi:MAG TPA: NADH-quinone oxidoreductase subunit J [Terriglobales bacterium]